MREDTNARREDIIDLGAATELTQGIEEKNAFEELLGRDYREEP
jgi:hypothetical protein